MADVHVHQRCLGREYTVPCVWEGYEHPFNWMYLFDCVSVYTGFERSVHSHL